MILGGGGVMQDVAKGLSLYREAVRLDYITMNAYTDLVVGIADSFLVGSGNFLQDVDEALRLYRDAADMGNLEAFRSLGQLYSEGEHVKKNAKKAREFFYEGVKRSDATFWVNLAETFQDEHFENWYKCWERYLKSTYFWGQSESNHDVSDRISNARDYLIGLDKWRASGQLKKDVDQKYLQLIIDLAEADDMFKRRLFGREDEVDTLMLQIKEYLINTYDKDRKGYWNTTKRLLGSSS